MMHGIYIHGRHHRAFAAVPPSRGIPGFCRFRRGRSVMTAFLAHDDGALLLYDIMTIWRQMVRLAVGR